MQTYSKHMADSKPFIVNSKIITFVCTITIVAVIYFLASPRNVNGTVRLSTSKASSVTRTVFSAKLGINHAIATVDENFLSVCLTWRRRDMWKYDATTEKRLIALSKALSPAYVRIGGTPSDFVIFESSSNPYGELTVHVAKEDLDRINEIARNAGWQVLFTLSVLKRLTKGSWDPSNPYEIVKYVAEKRYKFGWELGNDPFGSSSNPSSSSLGRKDCMTIQRKVSVLEAN